MRRQHAFGCLAVAIFAVVALGAAAAAVVAGADAAKPDPHGSEILATLKAKYRRPADIPFPADNGYSDAKSLLGQTLFFDPRLSGPGTHSCASCHNPALGWRDGLPVGIGHDARALPRSTPTIVNLAWGALLMWDGRKDSLEDQAINPVQEEMGLPLRDMQARLAAVPSYRTMFKAAFGSDGVTIPRVAQALATFERTLVSNEAPFDRWIRGDDRAIGVDAKHGFELFTGRANCSACHTGWRFTDDGFHDTGLPDADLGRGVQVPDEPTLQHAFKTPTLRNVATRTPYMHNGSIRTLQGIVAHYDTGFVERPSLSPEMHRLGLTGEETGAIVAFLNSLTSVDDPVVLMPLPMTEQIR